MFTLRNNIISKLSLFLLVIWRSENSTSTMVQEKCTGPGVVSGLPKLAVLHMQNIIAIQYNIIALQYNSN